MPDKKVDKSSEELEGEPVEELESEELDETLGGRAEPSFFTVTVNPIKSPNDSPIKK